MIIIPKKVPITVPIKPIANPIKKNTFKHTDDASGKSFVTKYSINLDEGEIQVGYTNWSDKMKYTDHVGVSISTTEVINWTRNNYGAN